MADRKYLKLKSRKDDKLYKIRLGEFTIQRVPTIGNKVNRSTMHVTQKGADFYTFMLDHPEEEFEIIGTKSTLNITNDKYMDTSYPVVKLTAVNKKGETITYPGYTFFISDLSSILEPRLPIYKLSIARVFLAVDSESNVLLPLPMETHFTAKYNSPNYYEPFKAFFTTAPYTRGIFYNERVDFGGDMIMQDLEPAILGSTPYNELTGYKVPFPGYEALATGDYEPKANYAAASTVYCALRNFSDPDPDNPTIPPIDIEYGFPGEPSGPGGGDGEMSDTNEETELKPPNILNVKYFTRVYKLTPGQVEQLRGYLWSDDFITNLPKLFSDPFSSLIGIQAVPLDITGNEVDVHIGTLNTGVNGVHVRDYYNTIDLGAIDITEYWQSFLDYQPYTRLKLFLPYIGIVDLPTDQFMNQSIGIKYRIDVLSGACIAVISNSTNIICQFTGNCATKMPISASDHSSIISNSLVGLTAVAGNVATGNVAGAVASSANVMLGLKEKIQISGSLSTNHGILVNDTPYLMIERPTSDIPAGYGALKGFTSNISLKLSACSGFTKVSDIKLDGISATDEEKTELLALLQTGVYL